MRIKILLLIFCAAHFLRESSQSPSGAPALACGDMTPRHGSFLPQPGQAPITIDMPQFKVSNSIISITIRSTDSAFTFRGFKIQARSMQGDLLGTFVPNDDVRLVDCPQGSAATHVRNNLKSQVTIEWEVPYVTQAIPFNFVVTIVEQFDRFWINQQFLTAVVPEGTVTTPSPEDNTTPTDENVQTTVDDTEIGAIFSGCGETKTCFGIPNNCYISGDCEAFTAVTYNQTHDVFTFELLSTTNQNYVAAGLSLSQSMLDASVIECVQTTPGVLSAHTSWTVGRSQANRAVVDQSIITLVESRLINGRLFCKVNRVPVSVVSGINFDLVNVKFYLLLASGTTVFPTSVTQHDTNRDVSQFPYLLSDPRAEPDIPGIFEGCAVTKTCFGIPSGCYMGADCQAFTAITFDEATNRFSFELLSTTNQNWIGMGLSLTPSMPETSVIECVQATPGVIVAYTSWTLGRQFSNRAMASQDIITMTESRFINGRIYCKVDRNPLSTVQNTVFDLVNVKYYLQVASGTTVLPTSVTQHDTNRDVSGRAVLLTRPQAVGTAGDTRTELLLIHGSFMIVAFIGTASIGITLARYFKPTSQTPQFLGKDVWFVWHVVCMFLTWALNLSGFIIIFIDMGKWVTSVHSVMGCVVFSLVNLQVFGALFRPRPDNEGRPLFNWLHKAFGNLTHLLAVICIFFAVERPRALLSDSFFWVLVSYLSFYLFMHIIFTSIDICAKINEEKRRRSSTRQSRFRTFNKTMFGLFGIIILLFVIALVLIFNIYIPA